MASIRDYGSGSDRLNAPDLPAWAAAVAAALNNSDTPVDSRVAGKVSKSGDTMTGTLTAPAVAVNGAGILLPDGPGRISVANPTNTALTTLGIADPVSPHHAATKQYVDAGKYVRAYGGRYALPGGTQIPGNGPLDLVSADFGGLVFAQVLSLQVMAITNGYVVVTRTAYPQSTGFTVNLFNLYAQPATGYALEWTVVGVLA